MKSKICFQYLPEGSNRPCSVTLSDEESTIKIGDGIPMVGDIVSLQYATPEARRGHFGTFKVVARHFVYGADMINGGGYKYKTAFIIVADADETDKGYIIRE